MASRQIEIALRTKVLRHRIELPIERRARIAFERERVDDHKTIAKTARMRKSIVCQTTAS